MEIRLCGFCCVFGDSPGDVRYEQQLLELSLQVTALEAVGQTEERAYFPTTAQRRQRCPKWE